MKFYATRIDMIAGLQPIEQGVEVGVQRGDFSAELLRLDIEALHLVDPWRHMGGDYSLDPADISDGGHEENLRHVLNRFRTEIAANKAIIYRAPSLDVAQKWKKATLDFVYLDGDHTFASAFKDMIAWAPAIKPGGCIMGHDFTERKEALAMGFGVVQAVNEFCEAFGWELVAVTREDWPSFMLLRK